MNNVSNAAEAPITVILAGNPNCGKTTLFNALTGARQHVGNYPGVTVERRSGLFFLDNANAHITDLPGTYSLGAFSPEEKIAADALLDPSLNVVVVVVDSTQLKRSLVLLVQIMQLSANPVLCLNMGDEARKSGQRIDVAALQKLLGFPVVETTGHKGLGIDELKAAISYAARHPVNARSRLVLGERLKTSLQTLEGQLVKTAGPDKAIAWTATRLLMGDEALKEELLALGKKGEQLIQSASVEKNRLEREYQMDIAVVVTSQYFGFVDGLLKEVTVQSPNINTRALSDAIDSVLVHRWLGVPFFLMVMYALFYATFVIGEYPMSWIEMAMNGLSQLINTAFAADMTHPIRSLLADGIVGGVGGVLVFLPNIVILFMGLALLEDTGYLARAAFLTDRVMHRFGLHGKSFIPLVVGFGCSIPGIMATRTMENEKDRLATILVLPLMSCGARLPIWMLLVPAFFADEFRAPMLFGIYFIGIALAFVLSLLIKRTLLKGEEAPFVMELPPYRLPTLRAVLTRMTERSTMYVKKAGTIILGISLVLWVVSSYPALDVTGMPEAQAKAARLEHSIAGHVGKAIEPALTPMGLDWKVGIGLIGAFAAKEVFVAQMSIIYAFTDTSDEQSLKQILRKHYSPLAGFALMLFLLIATPCMATVAITRRETGSWKWAALQFFGLTAVGYLLACAVYSLGSLFG